MGLIGEKKDHWEKILPSLKAFILDFDDL